MGPRFILWVRSLMELIRTIVTSLVTDAITPTTALASGKGLQENFVILRYSNNSTTRALGKDPGDINGTGETLYEPSLPFSSKVTRNEKMKTNEKDCEHFRSIPAKALQCLNCTMWIDWSECTRVANLEREARAILAPAGASTSQPQPVCITSEEGRGEITLNTYE
ncbi:hypothetical protein BGZ79_006591 [Entomortierella chlamydospora]|nr:hypothetical protein BGZ79_006591 [Entomortierella chlamydospora]